MTNRDLQEWRKINHLTQKKAAELLGVATQTIRQWESGHYYGSKKPISIPKHIALAISAIDSGLKPFTANIAPEWDNILWH